MIRKPPASSADVVKYQPLVGAMRLSRLSMIRLAVRLDLVPDRYSWPPYACFWAGRSAVRPTVSTP